jgi:hypothetical protein
MANRYWVGGTGTWNTSSTTNWSASSGGTSGASVPTAADSVFFDQAGTYTVTMTGALLCLDITVSAGVVTFATGTTPTLAITGSMSLLVGTVWNSTGAITFNSTTTGKTITTNGVTINAQIVLNGVGGGWSLGSSLTLATGSSFILTAGAFSLNGFDSSVGQFSSNNSNVRSIAFGSNNITLTNPAGGTMVDMATVTNLTLTATTGGFLANSTTTTRTFTFGTTGGTTSNSPNLTFTGTGTATPVLTTGSWFNKLDFGATGFTMGTTSLNLNGLTLGSGAFTTPSTFTVTMVGTGTITPNGKNIGALTINTAGTVTFAGSLALGVGPGIAYTQTAGTVNFASYNLTLSFGSASSTGGTLNNIGTITVGTGGWTHSGTLNLSSGTISTPSFTISSGSLTTSTVIALTTNGTFTHTAGTVTSSVAWALGTTSTYTLTAGTLTLGGNLTVGIFAGTGTGVRSIAFSTYNILLTHPNVGVTVLSFANATNFTWTGTGGFSADASVTRTYVFGTTGGSSTTAPNLSITTGAAIPTITTNSWFNNLDFTGGTNTPAVSTINVTGNLTLATGGTYTNLTINTSGTSAGTIVGNSKTLLSLTFNSSNAIFSDTINITNWTISSGVAYNFSSGTVNATNIQVTSTSFTYSGTAVLGAAASFAQSGATSAVTFNKAYALTATGTYTLTAGTLTLGDNLTTGSFSSNVSGVRSISFNTYNIILAHSTAGTVVLSCGTVTNFTWTGTGGFLSDASVTRTYTFGSTTGGSSTNAPNLTINSGTAVPTFTNNSWFNILDFTGSSVTNTSATVVNVNSAILSVGGTFTVLQIEMVGTGSLTSNGKSISYLGVSNNATATLVDALNCASSTLLSGSLNISSFNFVCSGTIAYRGTVLTNIGTITCVTWQIQTATFDFTSGTINPSSSFVVTSGTFNYSGGTLGPVPTFTQTAGTVSLGNSYALTSTGTYAFNGGQLNLANYQLTTAIFNAGTGATGRAIDFSTSSVIQITGNNATVLDLSSLSSYTGTVKILCTYVGSVGTRIIWMGTAWTEATAFDIKCSSCVGVQVYGAATDTIELHSIFKDLDFTGMNFTYSPAEHTIFGNYTIPATGGSVATSTSTVNFASTSATARTITISRSIDFGPITFNGIGGTFNLGANLTTTKALSLISGTLVLNGYNITAASFASNNSNVRTLNFGSNSISVSGAGTAWDTTVPTNLTISGTPTVNVINATVSSTTIVSGPCTEAQAINFNFTAGTYALVFLSIAGHTVGDVNFNGFTGTLNATQTCTIYGSYSIFSASSAMTVTSSSNVLTFGATGGSKSITGSTKTLPPIAINGLGGTFNLGSNLISSGAIQVLAGTLNTTGSNYSITCTSLDSSTAASTRAINLNGSTVTVSGTAGVTLNQTNLTFSAGTSQLTLSNATSTVLSVIGSATFRNVSFTGGAPSVTIVGTNTYNNLTFTNGSAAPSVATITGNQTVSGTLSNSSTNATTRLQLQSSVSGTQVILSAAVESLNDVDFKDIDAAGAAIPFAGTRFGNLGNNTDITFDVGVNKYWNLAAGGNWNAIAWATSSGGTVDVNNFPLAQDTCIISNTGLNTSATITMNGNWNFGTLDMSARFNAMTLAIGTTSPTITGNFTSTSFPSITGTGTINFKNVGTTQTITYPTTTFNPNINIDNPGGTVQLGNTLNLSGTSTFTLTKGTFFCNSASLTTGIFSSNNTNTRVIAFGTAQIFLAHTTAGTNVLDMANASGFTYTGTGGFSTGMSITRTFTCGTITSTTTPPNLTFSSGASVPTFTTGSYFTNLFFGDSSTPAAAVVNLYGLLTLSSTGTYTSLGVTMLGTGTITPNGKTIAAFAVNTAGTVTLAAAFGCTSFTMTAGTINFASFQLTDSGTATYTAGTMNNISTITCTTWTTQGTFAHSAGTITPSVSFVITSGSYTQSGTSVLSAVPTFTHTAGNVTFRSTYALTATGTYTLTAGTLTLGGDLTTGIFSSTNTNTRSIAFSTFNIVLAHTTAAQVVLGMDTLTGFSWTGTGGFTSAMSVTRTFQSGTTAGATSTSVPNLSLISGASIPTITTGGSFKNLNFTGSTSAPASTSISIYGDLTLASGGTYSTFTAIMVGSAGNVNGGGSTSLLGLNINNSGGTTTLTAALTLLATGVTTLTSGNLNLGGFTLTTGTFSSNLTNVRSITFGTANIILATTTAAAVNLAMADATNFTYTSSGTYGSGTGCFQATMSTTRTFQFGSTAGGSATNAPRLYLASGISVATLTTASWFNEIDFGTTGYTTAATNLNLASLKSNLSTSVLTLLTATMVGSGSIRTSASAQIGPLVINTSGITTTLAGTTLCTTTTLTLGTLDLNSQTLTCSSTFTWNGGSLLNFGTLSCTTFTLNGPTLSLTAGTLNPSTSFVLTTGSFTYGGTATLGATTTFTHTAGSATFNKSYALNTVSTYTLASGSLTLANGVTLSTGIFSSSNTATRSIGFGSTISSGSVSFNGTSQYLTVPAASSGPLDFATGQPNWTIECWFKASSIPTSGAIFWKASGAANPIVSLWLRTGGILQWITSDGSVQDLGVTVTAGTWYHVALVRSSSTTITAYVNGVAGTPLTTVGTLTDNFSSPFLIGNASDTRLFPGVISNFRVTKGVAVYTGSFTVPTSPLSSTQSSGTNISAITGTQTSLLLNTVNGSGFLTDSSSFAATVTNVGTALSSPSYPFVGNINLTHTTAATVVLSMADLTNYSYTGSGGFTVNDMGSTRTFTYGSSAGGSTTTAINLSFTTGASAITITNGSWFNTLDYGATTSTSTGTTISIINSLFLNGTYTAMTFSMLGTGYLSGGASSSVLGITINTTGTITMSGNLTMLATGLFTLTRGSLVLNGYTLTVGRFISDATGFTRSVDFGSTNIVLAHSTAGTIVLTMADLTGFTYTGTGGFTSSMDVTRIFQYGSTAGGSSSTAVNLSLTGGASIPTITTGGWYKNLNFTGNASTPAVTALNITGNLTLATGGTYTNLSATMLGTSTITPAGKTIAAFTVNTSGTITLAAAFGCTTYAQTAGTINFATFNMTCSSTVTYIGGTLSNIGTLTCTTFTLNGPTFAFSSGTITPSVSFVITSGSFTYSSPAVLSAVPTFTQTAGNVTLNQAYSLTATGTYTLTSGALTLGGNLTTGIFNTNSQLFRSIAFSTYNIVLAHTTAAQTVLNMPDIVNFSYTGTGTFTTSMSVTRTFTSGTQMGIPGSIAFNGTTSSLLYATNPGFAYSTATDFTWEAWVYTASNTTTGGLFDNRNTNVDLTGVTAFVVGGQAYWYNLGLNSGAGGTFGTTAANSIPNNTWTHVAFQRRGTAFEIYINGTLASTYTPSSPIDCGASSQRLYVGRDSVTSGISYFAGQVTNVRVVKGTAVYTGTFTVPTVPLSAAQNSSTNIAALDGFTTYLMLNAARGSPITDSSVVPLSATAVAATTNSTTPFPDAYYGQYPNLKLTSGVSVATFTVSSLFNTLDFTGSTTPPTGTVSINNLTLDTSPVYTSLSVICVGTGSIIQNNKTLSAFTVNNGYVGGTVTIVTNPLTVASYTQTSGTIDFSSLTFTVSGIYTYVAGTQLNLGTITCGTLTVTGTYNFSSGTINPTAINVLSPGVFTYSGTATLGAAATFTHTSGSVIFNKAYALTATGTYTLVGGTLTLGANLTTGIFSSNNANVRVIDFSIYNIILAHTTAATLVLVMNNATNFSWSGIGGFASVLTVNRAFTFGLTGGSATNAVNLSISGASGPNLGSSSIYNNLDFTGHSGGTSANDIRVAGNLTLSSAGTYTSLQVTAIGTSSTFIANGKSLGIFIVNTTGTLTLGGAFACTDWTQTAGTFDFASYNLTCSSTGTYTGGTLVNVGTITCTSSFNVNGTFAHTNGTISPGTIFSITSGSYTQSGTAVLSATPTFNHTAGDVTFRSTYALTSTGTYTLTAGTLTLGGNLTTGIFSSTGTGVRSIAFGSYNIVLSHTTAATTVLDMAIVTNFTKTGTGGFAADASITRTYTFGTTSGSVTNSPNLSLTGSGTAIGTFTTGSWFDVLNFGTTAFTVPATTLNVNGLTLSSGGTYTNLTVTAKGTGSFTSNGKTISTLTVDTQSYTATLADAMSITNALTLTSGTLDISSFNLTSGTFASTGTLTRLITGSGIYTITGSGATAFSNASATGITITGIIISMTSASAKTFAGGGGSYSKLNQGGAGTLTISGNNTFGDITATTRPSTISFTASSTQSFTNFTLSGTLGNLVTINSTSSGTRFNLSRASGTTSVGYLNIQDSNATGGASWYADTTSFNVGNNLGWIFTAPVGGSYLGNFFLFF